MDSEIAMCSDTSATDQRSGAGLNFHCFSDNPEMDFRKASWVACKLLRAASRSPADKGVAGAGTAGVWAMLANASVSTRHSTADNFHWIFIRYPCEIGKCGRAIIIAVRKSASRSL